MFFPSWSTYLTFLFFLMHSHACTLRIQRNVPHLVIHHAHGISDGAGIGVWCAGRGARARSSLNKPFKNGHNIQWRVVLGSAPTMMYSEPAVKFIKRQSAASPLSGFAFSSGAGKVGPFMMRTGTRTLLVVDQPCRTLMCNLGGKMSPASRNR